MGNACVNVIGQKCAARIGAEIGHLEIDAVCAFDRRGVTLAEEIEVPFTAITLTVRADGPADADTLARVGAETEKFCPLSKLFRAAGTELGQKAEAFSGVNCIIWLMMATF